MGDPETLTRRDVMKHGVFAATASLAGTVMGQSQHPRLHLACNQYSWHVFYRREGRDFNAELERSLGDLTACGLDGYEPTFNSVADVDRLEPLLQKHKLEMRSFYVNSTLHEASQADDSIQQVLALAQRAKTLGARICVTNPSPIRWGGDENKNDDQLKVQAIALDRLGQGLKDLGLTLAYHNHDPELRAGAREFHHMMVATDPNLVSFCLDSHWIYRGCENSQVALFDVVKLYASRICELHLRQSQNGTWSEVFGRGDIDYPRLAQVLHDLRIKPHCVLEQAVEEGTPKTLSVIQAFKQSTGYARRVFGVLGT